MRRTEVVTVPAWPGNRDAGKTFVITEMSAPAAERWAYRMFAAMKGTRGRVPENIESLGIVGVAIAGLNAFLGADVDVTAIEPLLDQMLSCLQIVRDPRRPDIVTPLTGADDIEEVKTLMWLRSEIVRVHTDFSAADAFWKIFELVNASAKDQTSSNIETSQGGSASLSPGGSQRSTS